LATILREYVARKKELPGIRSDKDIAPWPSLPNLRPGATSLSSNGGDYVTARRLLLSRFAVPWLLELHELDTAFKTLREPSSLDCQIMSYLCDIQRFRLYIHSLDGTCIPVGTGQSA
jgi:hypothetical protein